MEKYCPKCVAANQMQVIYLMCGIMMDQYSLPERLVATFSATREILRYEIEAARDEHAVTTQ